MFLRDTGKLLPDYTALHSSTVVRTTKQAYCILSGKEKINIYRRHDTILYLYSLHLFKPKIECVYELEVTYLGEWGMAIKY
jgi:hypothetical protein